MISRRGLLQCSAAAAAGMALPASDSLIVKAILGRRFDWAGQSPVD
jgi:hypothetical protein